jgi:hypothetical protein
MIGRTILVLGSVLFSLLAVELGARLWLGRLADWRNIVLQDRRSTLAQGGGRLMHDARLGFISRPGFARDGFSYDAQGFRTMPAVTPATGALPPILVVGDSFAHGDEVADNETWPAQLQALMGRRVINAAVSGYGFDQMVLRAELIAPELRPAAIVLSFIGDDARRSEMKRVWGAEKPYFDLVGGKLELRNTPVPRAPDPVDTLDIWQTLFGWSVALDALLKHKGWQYEWAIDHERALPRGRGELVACALFKRLATLQVPVLVVAERDTYTWRNAEYAAEQAGIAARMLKCAADAGFSALDLFPTIDEVVKKRGYEAVFRSSHPSPVGTEAAAERIARELSGRYIPPVR